jgi:hypothetical protein
MLANAHTFRINWQQAATEFVVIVFGVLVALAVDEWRSEREDRITEHEYIARIRSDILADIDKFGELERRFQSKAETIKELTDHPDSDLFSRDTKILLEGLRSSAYVALPDSRSTTFDELMSTGRLALIENVKQRDALSQYYSGFEHISVILLNPIGDYRRLLYETLEPNLLIRNRSLRDPGEVSNIQHSLERLVSHPDFLPAANAEIVYADALLHYLREYRNEAEQLLELIGT